ncbi:hypothetical protein AS030_21070 [Fictibacillus enclensis]|uniref:Uncharacterized protein n=1 Tax=Fictibacillus enclensis TaxID=1017270 RepID=A0A0V8IY44_9BACL|nr:hypothetical protein AS030_21070 [Fictibacillus enclensis]
MLSIQWIYGKIILRAKEVNSKRAIENFPKFILDNYVVHKWRHASAILQNDFPDEWLDLVAESVNYILAFTAACQNIF